MAVMLTCFTPVSWHGWVNTKFESMREHKNSPHLQRLACTHQSMLNGGSYADCITDPTSSCLHLDDLESLTEKFLNLFILWLQEPQGVSDIIPLPFRVASLQPSSQFRPELASMFILRMQMSDLRFPIRVFLYRGRERINLIFLPFQ
jgi:hypothetical protein